MRCKRRRISAALRCALAMGSATTGLAFPVLSQDAASTTDTPDAPIKVFVTGTNIPAVERETGLPVQIITREAIERANIETAAQLVNTISANVSYGSFTENQAPAGLGSSGLAGAGLRGLSLQRTLVLLNGRRLANYAFTGSATDLNIIPLAAIDRVEVLLDGASAIYGSDAIGGVINFILRSEFTGFEATAQYSMPQQSGGWSDRFNMTAGYGSLAQQKFNVFGTLDYQRFGGLPSRDRDFSRSYYIPGAFDATSSVSFPANVFVVPNDPRNPTGSPLDGYRNPPCAPPASFTVATNPAPWSCRFDPAYFINNIAPSERFAATGNLTWQVTPDEQFFVNGLYARNTFTLLGSPTQISRPFLQPSSPFYPHEFAAFFGIDGRPLNTAWRSLELGPRTNESVIEQWNVVAGMRGTRGGWSYDGAFSYGENNVDDRFTGGYLLGSVINPLLNSGRVNPFGYNTPDVLSLMSAAVIDATVRTGKSTLTSFDVHASKEVYNMPAGPLSLAMGIEARRWQLSEWDSDALESGNIVGVGVNRSYSASRDIGAVFAEVNVPIINSFEADLAVRFDHYSDVGSTTNPKLSLRWQPDRTVVFRASAGTGFHAPGLVGLYGPPVFGTTGQLSDPARCPVTESARDCNVNFPFQSGGNPALQSEKSTQWGVGALWSPVPSLSIGVDYFDVAVDNLIFALNASTIFQLCPDGENGQTCQFVERGPVEPAYPTLPGPVRLINQSLFNIGTVRVTGIDVNALYRFPKLDWGQFKLSLQGTYITKYQQQQINGSYLDQVNHELIVPFVGAIPYWRHYLTLDWTYGPWSATMTQNFQAGTYDVNPNPGETQLRTIGDYSIWNLSSSYSGFANWQFSVGVKNIADRDPPFTNQTGTSNSGGPAGYDPTYTDPRGRVFWASVKYAFR